MERDGDDNQESTYGDFSQNLSIIDENGDFVGGYEGEEYMYPGIFDPTGNGEGNIGNPQDTPQQQPDRQNVNTVAQGTAHREPAAKPSLTARSYGDPVPDEPLKPRFSYHKNSDCQPCKEWPGFTIPVRWTEKGVESTKRLRSENFMAERFLGLDQPWPLPYELLEAYIKRRAASRNANAEEPEHVAWCTEQ